jgi:hypothetical protein
VSVQRRRARAQAIGEQTHAEVCPDLVEDLERGADDPVE